MVMGRASLRALTGGKPETPGESGPDAAALMLRMVACVFIGRVTALSSAQTHSVNRRNFVPAIGSLLIGIQPTERPRTTGGVALNESQASSSRSFRRPGLS